MKFREKASVRNIRIALAALAGVMTVTAQAQSQNDTSKSEVPQRIEITGSHIKRVDKETSSPVQTITAKEIMRTGATSVAELMRTLPVFGGGNVIDQNNRNSFSEGVSTVSLRGFGSASTLVLLNGRRIAPAAIANPNDGQSIAYDVNSIPLVMIERIEILKDGASAIYGSDAIAGVVNFITKSNFQGGSAAATYSANHQGKFGNTSFSGGYGYGDLANQGFNIVFSAEAKQRDRVKIRDADENVEQGIWYDMIRRNNPLGSAISNQAFFYKERSPGSASFATTGATAQLTSGPNAIVLNKTNCSPDRLLIGSVADHNLTSNSRLVGRQFCNFDTYQYSEAQGAGKDLNLFVRGTLNINDKLSAYGEVVLTANQRDYTGAPRTISGTSPSSVLKAGAFAGVFQPILPIGHPDNPFTNARAAVDYRFENSNTDSRNEFNNFRILGGLKGSYDKFDWEAGALWHRAKLKSTYSGMLYFPSAQKLYTENRSLASMEADPTLLRTVINNNTSDIQQLDAKASTEFGALPGGAFGLAAGVEVRRESMNLTPDAALQRGDIVGLANVIVEDARTVSSTYAELRAPVLKNLELDVAGRFDKYPGFKTSFVPKAGFKWTVNNSLSLRGTYAEGFRAPSLSQLSKKGVQSFSSILDPLRCNENSSPAQPKPGAEQADCNKSYSKSSGGSANGLEPEKSKSYTFGLIWSPSKSFDVLVDFYKIRREDETAVLSATTILKDEQKYAAYIRRDPNPSSWIHDAAGNVIQNSGPLLQINTPYYNRGSTETSGMDVEMAIRNNLGNWGKLSSRLNIQYIISYRIQENKGDFETNVVGQRSNYADWNLNTGASNPRFKANFSISWDYREHSLSMSVRHVDGISLMRWSENGTDYAKPFCQFDASMKGAEGTNATQSKYMQYFSDCKIPSWTTVGLAYSYSGFKNWNLSFNVQNLFNKKAPYDPDQTTSGYSQSLHNNYGRVYGASASYSF